MAKTPIHFIIIAFIAAFILALAITLSAPLVPSVRAQNTDPGKQALEMKFETRKAFPGSFGSKQGELERGTLDAVAGNVISLMLRLLATVGIVVCIYGAWRMMTAMGNSGTLKKGQEAFMNAIIGIIIVLLSYVIVALVRDIILQVK